MQEQADLQRVPVKMYRSDDRLTVAAPMPGLQPEDVAVEITAQGKLMLHGELRGVLKGMKELLLDEWSVGGYQRDVELPDAVNGELATVTYGNGVLVVTMPLAEQTRPARLRMEALGFARGERVGSAGHPIAPKSTDEHRAHVVMEHHVHGEGYEPHEGVTTPPGV
jgi:HSP20 family protein